MQNIEITNTTKIPIVEVLKNGNMAKISIKCETGIRTVSYAWNDSTDIIVQGRGNSILEQTISIPSGENKLNISRETIRKIESKTLRKLRYSFKEEYNKH